MEAAATVASSTAASMATSVGSSKAGAIGKSRLESSTRGGNGGRSAAQEGRDERV
jgi:hypothetical protein